MGVRTYVAIAAAAVVLASGVAVAVAEATGSVSGGTSATENATPKAPPLAPQSMAVVATVDGDAIPVREFELFLAQDRAATFAYFQQRFGAADNGAGFWSTAHDGQTPTAYLEHQALADATNVAVQRALAHKYGLLADTGYAVFLQALDSENARRELALSQHQPIYGPVQYTEANYFTYLLGQQIPDIQAALVRTGVITVTETALRQYYAAHARQFEGAPAASHGSPVVGPVAPAAPEPFAQVEPQVRQLFIQQQYDAYVAKLTAAATVHVDRNVLARVPVD